jgi:outer membrane protein assembly factor BamB
MKLSSTILLAASLFICSLPVRGDDWPQWRGPSRDGVSRETGLLKEWPKEGPKLAWQVTDLAEGFSTPSVVGDRIYVLANQGQDDESVQARSAADGKVVWSTRLGKVGPNTGPQYPAARSTPTVDGAVLYALGSDGDLACVETTSGKIRWQKSLRSDFGGKPGQWAYAESPLIDGDFLVCTPGGAEATLVALNKTSGDVIWKSAIPDGGPAAFASAIVAEIGGVKQYVQFLQNGLVGVEARTGKFLWRYDQTAKGSPAVIPTPLARDGLVFSSAARTGGGLVKLNPSGDGFQAEQLYFSAKLPNAIGGTVIVGSHLYGTSNQGLICAEFATGDVKWTDRSVGAGSVCFADGNLYLHGENGEVALVEATPEAYREKGRFAPPGQPDRKNAKAWAYPVIANGRLYVRDIGVLWCYDVKGE